MADKGWRPPGWDATQILLACGKDDALFSHRYALEAAADALLEGLFKLAEESSTKTFIIDAHIMNIYKESK